MTQHKRTLRQILVRIADEARQGRESLAVFDLDSTLFDVGPRLEKILAEFAEIEDHQKRFPDQVRVFNTLKVHRGDWGVADALVRAGIDGHHSEFQHALKEFWRVRFFSDSYLHYDVPYPGAVEYVKAIQAAGAKVAYLTGRDVARMGKGSEEVLRKWDFPVDDRAVLELKPHKDQNDALFKTEWFLKIPDGTYPGGIWFFENEPVNINRMRVEAKHVEIVFLDTTHSRAEQPPDDIPRVLHFLLDDDEES